MGRPPARGQNRAMALKLFRSTGYSSILTPGETRLAMHPGWMVLAVSLWIGFVANVALWRVLSGNDRATSLAHVLVLGAAVAAAAVLILSVLGWRRTMKPAAILLLLLSALVACVVWSRAYPVDATLLERPPASLLLPSWASLLRWQVSGALAGLALVPAIWVWQKQVRRLAGGDQLRFNVAGAIAGAVLFGAARWLLAKGIV